MSQQKQPARLIDILAENTQSENLDCLVCQGQGEVSAYDTETGTQSVDCQGCQGSGFNQLGLILQGILSPPEEGFGAIALKETLEAINLKNSEQPTSQPVTQTVEKTSSHKRRVEQPLGQYERSNVVSLDRLEALADRKYELSHLKKKIQRELERVDDELKDTMLEGEIVYARSGVGYRLGIVYQDIYKQNVIQELDNLGLLQWFSKVSTTRLKEMVQKGLLSWEQFLTLQDMASKKEILTLREVINPEVKVI